MLAIASYWNGGKHGGLRPRLSIQSLVVQVALPTVTAISAPGRGPSRYTSA